MIYDLKGQYSKDCKIFTDIVEEEALKQVYDLINHPAFKDAKMRFMPDIHAGKGATIGTTIVLDKFVNPNHVGVDIGCTVTTLIFNTTIPKEKYAQIERLVRKSCPMGFELRDTKGYANHELYDFLQKEMDKARSLWPEMVEHVSVNEQYVTRMCQRIGIEESTFYKSIGSVGGGNHFIEYGETDDGKGAWTIHCGSRNFGLKVCKYWANIAKNPGKLIDIKDETKKIKEKFKTDRKKIKPAIDQLKKDVKENYPTGYLFGEGMKGYLTDLFFAQAYARFNHKMIAKSIWSAMKLVCTPKTDIVEEIQSIHNYINPMDHIIRKGAIRSYKGEKMVIPFNMRDGIAICEGKSNPDWNFSAPHGAGRIMSRAKAKKDIAVKDFEETMRGIYSTSVGQGTLDESPMAYKNMQDIVDRIEDTCDILYFIKPLINIKAKDSTEE